MSSEDFYKQLYASLEDTEDNQANCCLITDQPLLDFSMKLDCGHTFNYVPLYHDIANHKQKYNVMESNLGALKTTEIRCPYCRMKHPRVLPFYESLGLPKLNGVNAVFKDKMCAYLMPNPNYLPDEPIDGEFNFKFLKCKCYGLSDQEDAEFYCDKHKRALAKEAKALEKEAKALEKEAKALLLKQKKDALVKKKEETEQKKTIPVVLCETILKSGQRKGEKCNSVATADNCCKRHSVKQ
jgi:hypothetical protein